MLRSPIPVVRVHEPSKKKGGETEVQTAVIKVMVEGLGHDSR
jgi:hypothetical protein